MRIESLFVGVAVVAVAWMAAVAQEPTREAGSYTAEQAARGEALYAEQCAACHGADLDGGAAGSLIGPTFTRTWSRPNVTVNDLHFIISTTMPPLQVGGLTEAQYLEILAFILQRNGVPSGTQPLRSDRGYLLGIRMESGDVSSLSNAPTFIAGDRGMVPTGTRPGHEDLLRAADEGADWLHHTRTYEGTRYSPLSQINRDNVESLRPQCLHQVGDPAPFQTGPLVHDGTMYITGVHVTAAIDAATCTPRWRHVWDPRDREVWRRNRGVAIKDGYVVRGMPDGYLLALDAADGSLLWARQVAKPWLGETFTMPPMIFEDRILIGPAGSEHAISGWVGAFRLTDGEPIWRFDTVPGATRSGGTPGETRRASCWAGVPSGRPLASTSIAASSTSP